MTLCVVSCVASVCCELCVSTVCVYSVCLQCVSTVCVYSVCVVWFTHKSRTICSDTLKTFIGLEIRKLLDAKIHVGVFLLLLC